MLGQRSYGDGLFERLIAALRLDLELYQLVSADPGANSQAFRVVLLAGVSNGLSLVGRLGTMGVAAGVGAAILGWLLWTGVIWLVATLLGQRATGRSLLRGLAFANSPGVLLIVGIVPVLGAVARFAIVLWLVATTMRAVQAVFEVTRRRAMVIAVGGFVVYLILGLASASFVSS